MADASDKKISNKVNKVSTSKFDRKKFLGIAIIALLILAFIYLKNEVVVATVNGKPITRFELVQALESQAGQQALDGLVIQEIIRQEAAKANITVEKKDVDAELSTLEKELKDQGQELDAFLELQGLTRADITKQLELQIMLQKLTEKDAKVSEKDVEAALAERMEQAEESDEETDEESMKAEVTEALQAQANSDAIQKWIESARENAKVNYYKQF